MSTTPFVLTEDGQHRRPATTRRCPSCGALIYTAACVGCEARSCPLGMFAARYGHLAEDEDLEPADARQALVEAVGKKVRKICRTLSAGTADEPDVILGDLSLDGPSGHFAHLDDQADDPARKSDLDILLDLDQIEADMEADD